MNSLFVLLIGCGLLQQATADLPLKSADQTLDDAEKNPLKYYSHSPEYVSSLPKLGGGSPDYFICKKTILNSYEPVDLIYSNGPSNRVSLRR